MLLLHIQEGQTNRHRDLEMDGQTLALSNYHSNIYYTGHKQVNSTEKSDRYPRVTKYQLKEQHVS